MGDILDSFDKACYNYIRTQNRRIDEIQINKGEKMDTLGKVKMIIRKKVEAFHNEDGTEELTDICIKMFGIDKIKSEDCQRYIDVYLAAKRDVPFFIDEYLSRRMIKKMVEAFGGGILLLHPMISDLLEGLTSTERIDAERMDDEMDPKAYYINFMDQEIFPCGEANKYIADIMWRVASKIFTGDWPKTMPPDWKPDYPTVDDLTMPQRTLIL